MARLFAFFCALIGGIAVIAFVGVFLLPVVAGILIAWGVLAFLRPGRSEEVFPPPAEAEEDVPANQAVIDVTAIEVNDEPASTQEPRKAEVDSSSL